MVAPSANGNTDRRRVPSSRPHGQAISTGVDGYPVELAAPIALGATAAHGEKSTNAPTRSLLGAHPGAHDEVRFVLFDAATLAAFARALTGLVAARRP